MTNREQAPVVHYLHYDITVPCGADSSVCRLTASWKQVTCPHCIDKMPLDVKCELFSGSPFGEAPTWWQEWMRAQQAEYMVELLIDGDWLLHDDVCLDDTDQARATTRKREEERTKGGYLKSCKECGGSGCIPQALYDPPEQCECKQCECNQCDPPETDLSAENEKLKRENERLQARDLTATVQLAYETSINPFEREDLKVLDIGVSDNIYVVESETVQKLQTENEQLKKRVAEMEAENFNLRSYNKQQTHAVDTAYDTIRTYQNRSQHDIPDIPRNHDGTYKTQILTDTKETTK